MVTSVVVSIICLMGVSVVVLIIGRISTMKV